MRIITFGTYDLFHIGHLNILRNCKNFENKENYVIVGISSDKFNYDKKKKYPIVNERNRMEIIKSLKYVDEVFIEHSLEDKLKYCIEHKADILIMGMDHVGKFDFLKTNNIRVVYLPRTESISTSQIIETIK